MADMTEKPPPPDVDVEDPYYFESESEDGRMTWFEAGATVNGEHVCVEGRRLARCEMTEQGPGSMSNPTGDQQCYMHAVAEIKWGSGGTMKVCHHHYEDIREWEKRNAEPTNG